MMGFFQRTALRARGKLAQWQHDEQGMEIIQVLVLLAIGLGLVAVFIGFREQIMGVVNQQVQEFMDAFSS